MTPDKEYDIAIIGGGLAGLAAAILLSKQGHSVAVFEKEKYPFHKVCGEYVSMESWSFLEQLGIPLTRLELPSIGRLMLTAVNGKSFTTRLPLGGFGISRFQLDHHLAKVATGHGVQLFEETKVQGVSFNDRFMIELSSKEGRHATTSKICLGAFGKRSNLDIKWNRGFLRLNDKKQDNHIGVKYHIKSDWEKDMIGLHNFEGGYCGISKIENDLYCLCYMTRADELKKCGGDILTFQEKIMFQNPYLKKIFTGSQFCHEFPVTISQIGFHSKSLVENGVIMLGDAAGMITPLCGNGMSIAFHTAKLASYHVHQFLMLELSRQDMESGYARDWKKNFETRLQRGRFLQQFFGNNRWSGLFVSTFKLLPFLATPAVKMTHGKPF